jgi:glutamyl-Q tRNA(Asp) synthetase
MYIGRFAPSPTGPLHAGSVVAALGSWLDARAHGGQWLVRIEDVDTPRCVPGAAEYILGQLAALGLQADSAPVWQSRRSAHYAQALETLVQAGLAFGCACTRKELTLLQGERARHGELIYPGTCRDGLRGRLARAWRFRVPAGALQWQDRRLGLQQQDVEHAVGDFVLQRADGLWAYQLAVVVDDAEQGISDVVRGEDLADNTPRQLLLQRALALSQPRYLHLPLVLAPDGQKLSKQNGALPIDAAQSLAVLQAAGKVLGLPELPASTVTDWLAQAMAAWRAENAAL